MAILTVGVSGAYATIAAAVSAAQDGDTVQVEAGTYTNDFVTVTSRITLVGMGGTVRMVATVPPPNGKAILTVDADATVRNFDFSGARVADHNGAGIRYEGGDLDLENCSFHDNENGLLSAPIPGGHLTITGCDFYHNGEGSGRTHNLYVGDIDTLTITGSTFRDAVVGHEIKSRAETTIIQGCTIADGPTGNASYSIDLPNGGNALIRDNVIEKGPMAENQTVIHYGGEAIAYAGSALAITGNTVTNDLTQHATILLTNSTPIVASVVGNTFLGVPIPTYAVGPATLSGNCTADGPVPDGTSTDPGNTGSTIYIDDAADHTLVLDQPSMAVKAGAGHLTATGFSHETILGGTGGITWNGQDGADQLSTLAGSANTLNLGLAGSLVQSAGTDLVHVGSGNNSILVTGAATLTGGTGNNAIQVDGTAAIDGTGVDTISVGAHATVDATETGVVYLNSNGGTFSLNHRPAGAAADTITVSGGAARVTGLDTGLNVTMAGGGKGAVITLGTGTAVVASAGPDTIRAGAGTATVVLSGSAQVYQGTGTLTVFGHGILGTATVHGGTGTVTLDGDTGNIRFLAEGGASTVNARLSRISITGGQGLMTVNAQGGLLTVQGGSGGIVLNDGAGGQTVTTAAGARDTVSLLGGSTLVSNGTDQVNVVSSGNVTVTANGAATIRGGTGNSLFTLNGADTLLTRSTGLDRTAIGRYGAAFVTSSSASDSIDVAGGQLSYNASGSSAYIAGTAHLDHAAGSVAHVTTGSGAAARVIAGTTLLVDSLGVDAVIGGAGSVTVNASAGSRSTLTFGAGGGRATNYGAATVTAGAGAVTVDSWSGSLGFIGGAGAARVTAYAGQTSVTAGAGNMTLQGGTGALSFSAGTGAASVSAGTGGSFIQVGAGAVTVNAWSGTDVLAVQAGQKHGTVLVNNFDAASDRIQLDGYAAGSAKATSYAGGTLLTLADGTRLQFAGVSHLNGFA